MALEATDPMAHTPGPRIGGNWEQDLEAENEITDGSAMGPAATDDRHHPQCRSQPRPLSQTAAVEVSVIRNLMETWRDGTKSLLLSPGAPGGVPRPAIGFICV